MLKNTEGELTTVIIGIALALKKSGRLTEAALLSMLKVVGLDDSIYRSEFKAFESLEEFLVGIENRINMQKEEPEG